MTAVALFLRSPTARALLVIAALITALVASHWSGYRAGAAHEVQARAARDAEAAGRVAVIQARSAKISADARERHAADLARIDALTVQLQQKVKTYVTPQADRRCVIPVGYVRLRDAAGAGVDPVPGPAGGSLDADSGLVLSDLAANDIANAGAFNAAVQEVRAWRGWHAAQAELWRQMIGDTPSP